MWRARYALGLWSLLLSLHSVALAEGSAEFDAADTNSFLPDDQAVNTATVAYVDILDAGKEKICYGGNGTQLRVYRPKPDDMMLVGTLADGDCLTTVSGVNGAYMLDIGTQAIGTEWDIRVCGEVTDGECFNDDANERLGRLWSYDWSFQSNLNYSRQYSVNGSIYAIVPGGAADHDAVVEMQMRGVSGARYHLFANSYGPEAGNGDRIGRSASATMNSNRVRPEFPVYLNPPAVARYNWVEPVVTQVKIEPECGTAVVSGVAPGAISFSSNVVGQYVVICDVNKDNVYNFADGKDFSAFGSAVVGTNTATWDGRSKDGTLAAAGDYKCVIRLNVGEFHFMAEDIETSDPGIRMFRVEKEQSGQRARTPLRMFWDDSLVGDDSELVISSGRVSPNGSPPEGLDPGAYSDAFSAYSVDGATPSGNARAWGDYDEDGKGNDTFLDQFTSAASTQSAPITITVMTKDGDPDNDGLSTVRECELKSDPRKPDTDDDGVNDGAEATMSNARDTDSDGIIDILDNDDDGDGIPTKQEMPDENADGKPDDAVDTDGDGTPDYLDTDSDGDGVPDKQDVAPTQSTRCADSDNDTCDDCAQGKGADPKNDGPDSNGDGRCDAADDADGDGVDDKTDQDIDDDGIPNAAEGDGDLDNDGVPNAYDLDSDGDGLPDILEAGGGELDQDHDGRIDDVVDKDPKDGLHDPLKAMPLPLPDTDADGDPDFLDLDADGDGVPDSIEGDAAERTSKLDADGDGQIDDLTDRNHNGLADGVDPSDTLKDRGEPLAAPDTDDDGKADFQDADDDGDGRSTEDERKDAEKYSELGEDVDDDGSPNWRDADSDGDGVSDRVENLGDGDSDDDGIPDYLQPDVHVDDSDGDGVLDPVERPDGEDGEDRDTDGDGTPDYLDDDDDGDGIKTRDERPDGQDVDSDDDGTPDYLDDDDDDDGVKTRDERPNDESIDTDGDGQPNYLDVDDDDDGVLTKDELTDANRDGTPDYLQAPRGTLLGGARCSVTSLGARSGAASPWLCASLLIALLWLRRTRMFAPFIVCVVWVLAAATAHAQVALDQFKPAPLASDGFALSRPDVAGHLVFGATAWIDYANDPLAYEVTNGNSFSQERVVRDHLVLHAGLSLGLGDRVNLFALVPVHLIMKGQNGLTLPNTAPEGAGLGDVALGARIRLLGDPSTSAALSGEVIARLPTADLANKDQLYSGDAVGSYEPALIGEVRSGPFDVRLRAGARLRKAARVGNLDLDQELVYGLGARIRVSELLSLHAEVYGSTFFKDVFGRAYSPLELLAGAKVFPGDFVIGAAAGPGLFQGYGSPDVRIVGLVGYAPKPRKAADVPDSDGDGILDPEDRCPTQPEDADSYQDEDGCPDPDNDQDGILDVADRCPLQAEDRDQFEDEDGCPDPDNDKDGVLDAQDRCPLEPEDRDGFEDQDGCPDPDNDQDGLKDSEDKCPDQPEDMDGFEDSDGCPEEGSGLVKLSCDRIDIQEQVYFDTNADTIQPRSFALLDQVAVVLKHAKHVKRVRIEGHTDNRGAAQLNLDLSKRRAASVVRYLTEKGIEAARLESEGYGLTKPIADNNNDAGRAANRRVAFVVVEQSSQCK